YLSNLGDVNDMAKNAITILKDAAILEEFKANAKAHTKLFSLENILPVYEELYKSCSISV
ncbi:MAG: N-acetyl-alpha-D-glucosaminyl L-malate synthase BshA, partial [Polaribacter sp.]|nr:N-acetyl-alpha-D-glucosaminyl L-malate synthase BshA [Polaribacter sp.]